MIKLRFIPSNDQSKELLVQIGKKHFLDLSLKPSKTWRSVVEHLSKKWNEIPNLQERLELFACGTTNSSGNNLLDNINQPVLETLQNSLSLEQQQPPIPPSDVGQIYPVHYNIRPIMKQVLFPEDSLIKAIDNWNEMSVDNYLQHKASNNTNLTKPNETDNDHNQNHFKIPELPSSHYAGLESGNTMDNLINSNTMNGLLNDLLNGNTTTTTTTTQAKEERKESNESITKQQAKVITPSLLKSVSTTSIIHEINSNDILNLVETTTTKNNSSEFKKKSIEENVENNLTMKILKPATEGYSALLNDFTFSSNQGLAVQGNSLFMKDTAVSNPSRLKSTESNPAGGVNGQELGYDYDFSQQSNQSNRSNRNFAHIFDPQTNITTIKDEKKFNSLISMGNSLSCPPLQTNNPATSIEQKSTVTPTASSSQSIRKQSSTPQPPPAAAAPATTSLYQSIVGTAQNTSSSSQNNLPNNPDNSSDTTQKPDSVKKDKGNGVFGAFSPQTVVTPISDAENESNQSKNAQLLVQQSASNQLLPMNIFSSATNSNARNIPAPTEIPSETHINMEREGSNQSHTSVTTANLTTPMKQSRKRKFNGLQQKREELLHDFTSETFERIHSVSSAVSNSLNPSTIQSVPIASSSGATHTSNPLMSPPAKQPRKATEQQVLTEKIFSGLCHLSPSLGINYQKSSSFVHKFSRAGRSRPDLRRITPTYIGPLVSTITSTNGMMTTTGVTTSTSFMLGK